ncbi:MAG: DNA glycosylase AlkZ-like family protein, partial [Acidimicrobiales bacterium]
MTKPLTKRQLNRTTLIRQLLVEREQLSVVETVRRVTALQAQEPVSPYIALWNRIAGFDPSDLDRAFVDRAIVKASLMRITLHAVGVEDYAPFQRAMLRNLRASRLNDARFKGTGMTTEEADELVPHLLEFVAEPRARAEIEAMLADRFGEEPDKHLFWALRTFAALLHAPTGGPWSFTARSPEYQAAPLDAGWEDPQVALRQLIL